MSRLFVGPLPYYERSCYHLHFSNRRFQFERRRQLSISALFLPMSAKGANFSREAVERCACGLGRVPQRNVRIGNIANAL
jgi:hypothetical protein